MSTIFPGSASAGQVYNNYTFDGTAWNINGIDLTENYLEESSASATYLTKVSASNTYITQTSASTTYATKTGGTFSGNITAPEVRATTKLVAQTVGGDEGGEILLGKSATNTTLTGDGVTIDVWQNRLRIFEQGGDARGAYLDITKLSNGVSSQISLTTSVSTTPFVPGGYYRSRYSGSASHNLTSNKLVLCPIFVPYETRLDRIGWTTNSFSSAGNSRFGLYNDGSRTGNTPGKPSTLIVDAGTVSCTSGTTSFVISIDQTIPAGLYWMAGVLQSGSYTVFGMTGSSGNVEQKLISPTSTNLSVGYGVASVSGNLPNTLVTGYSLTEESLLPYVYVRAA